MAFVFGDGCDILEHPLSSLFDHLNGNKEQENGAYKCVNRGGRCDSSCMGFGNARMWTFNKTIIIEDESYGTHSNKTNTIQTWSPMENMVVLV